MQGIGGPDEDRSGGFERGGWAMPLFDNEARAFLLEVYGGRADAFLFGRKTYDIFAGYWGVMDPSEDAFAEALNTKPKYVASSTLTEPEWDDTTVLSTTSRPPVDELKAKPWRDRIATPLRAGRHAMRNSRLVALRRGRGATTFGRTVGSLR